MKGHDHGEETPAQEVLVRKCASAICDVRIPAGSRKTYCCAKCRMHAWYQRLPNEKKSERIDKLEAWNAAHVEEKSVRTARSQMKKYRSGKLPRWMFD